MKIIEPELGYDVACSKHHLDQWWVTCGPRATFMRPSVLYILSNKILLLVGCILMFIVNSEMKYIQYFPDCIGHILKHTLRQR